MFIFLNLRKDQMKVLFWDKDGLGINPREYLEDVMHRIMGKNSQKLYELLPDRWLQSRQQISIS